ncbi:hypothetical protein EDC94DRAFT_111997 [Helicostylum pulchrum]|nr:hypothetical protein EDC94DRAFT_111997 [Helicostylum pulchrum]
MAMDYKNSNFTVVDVLDLLPPDFEESAYSDNTDYSKIDKYKDRNVFTAMHPDLSVKLQSTTTPVVDSSTLDSNSSFSNILLSQEDEESNNTFDSTKYSKREQIETADHLFMAAAAAPPSLNYRKLLANLDFYQMNVLDAKLPFQDNQFDFVKQQLVTASFTVADWKRVMEELVRVTKPGGFIQLVEIDYNSFNLGPKGRKWETELLETVRLKRQMEPRMARHLPDLLKKAGLIDVSAKLVSIPLGSWGLDLGSLWKHNMEMFAESTSPLLSKLVGISDAEYRSRWRDLLQEVQGKRAFSNIHAAWGIKSESTTSAIDWSSWSPLI